MKQTKFVHAQNTRGFLLSFGMLNDALELLATADLSAPAGVIAAKASKSCAFVFSLLIHTHKVIHVSRPWRAVNTTRVELLIVRPYYPAMLAEYALLSLGFPRIPHKSSQLHCFGFSSFASFEELNCVCFHCLSHMKVLLSN